MRALRVAIDIGGTFTDLVAYDETADDHLRAKTPSTPPLFIDGVINALAKVQIEPAEITYLKHGSTIERCGAKAGLVMTRGMQDVLSAARANRPDLFNSNWDPSPPLIQRRNILEVGERVDYEGTVPTKLSEDDVRNAARKSRRAALRRSARWACLRPRGLSSRRWHDLRATRHTSAATPIAGGGMGWPLGGLSQVGMSGKSGAACTSAATQPPTSRGRALRPGGTPASLPTGARVPPPTGAEPPTCHDTRAPSAAWVPSAPCPVSYALLSLSHDRVVAGRRAARRHNADERRAVRAGGESVRNVRPDDAPCACC